MYDESKPRYGCLTFGLAGLGIIIALAVGGYFLVTNYLPTMVQQTMEGEGPGFIPQQVRTALVEAKTETMDSFKKAGYSEDEVISIINQIEAEDLFRAAKAARAQEGGNVEDNARVFLEELNITELRTDKLAAKAGNEMSPQDFSDMLKGIEENNMAIRTFLPSIKKSILELYTAESEK